MAWYSSKSVQSRDVSRKSFFRGRLIIATTVPGTMHDEYGDINLFQKRTYEEPGDLVKKLAI